MASVLTLPLHPPYRLTVFSGDACHPMLPYLAQGANSSLEDGAVLGFLLGKASSKAQVKDALGMYERVRKARGEEIGRETFKQVGPRVLGLRKYSKGEF
jgi:salicylate hydroxylase